MKSDPRYLFSRSVTDHSCATFRLLVLSTLVIVTGCSRQESSSTENERFKIVLQTDWYPQPEHGGFYQALVEGYYEAEGLDVEILPGGPNTVSLEKVALGKVQFAMGKSHDILIHASRGVPVTMVGAHMQHDPQALLFHQENPIRDFSDLDGKRIMAGLGMAYLELIRRKYQIEFDLLPLDYGIGQFLRDKAFIQQCFITSEPYFAKQQGANPGTLLVSESGFDPYHVWYTRSDFVLRHPDMVKKFNRATIKGWQNYILGDRSKANALLKSLNPKLDDEFMAYSVGAMIEHSLVTGISGDPSVIGTIDPDRIRTEIHQLIELDLLREAPKLEEVLYSGHLTHSHGTSVERNPTDLEVEAIWPSSGSRESRFITQDFLAALPHEAMPFQFTQNEAPLSAKVVYLTTVLTALEFEPSDYTVLAICSDQYQANFSSDSFETLKPYLVTEIEDQPTHEWAASKDKPGWGPYIIGIANEDGLKDPSSKQPWGVEKIELQPKDEFLAALDSKWPEELSASAQHGRTLFVNNCLNCHALDEKLGGRVSTRTVQIISIHAKSNPSYIRQMIYEPAKAFPDGIKMPAMPHYTDEDVQAVTEFLAAYSN